MPEVIQWHCLQLILTILRIPNMALDFRGLWADERITKGGWNMELFWHRVQFRTLKRIEQFSLKHSSAT